MDQLELTGNEKATERIPLPKKSLTTEFIVGLFSAVVLIALMYEIIWLAGARFFDSGTYEIKAEFSDISGLKKGASVEIAGVKVGEVVGLEFKDPMAVVIMRINNSVKIRSDDIFAVRTKGIIGDRYVKISRGSSDEFIPPGGTVFETESIVDFEDLIGKFLHRLDSDNNKD
ncbi:MAG: MCE family protein [Candidatus Dadabacteria bacterium]|nr:MAG: MCE family protein [Candidatus Dadabacteria bacterium]